MTQFKKKPVNNDADLHIKLVRELWSLDEREAAANMQSIARSIQHLKG